MSLLPERGTFKGLNELGFDYLNQSEEPFEEKKFRSPPTEVDERDLQRVRKPSYYETNLHPQVPVSVSANDLPL